MDPHVIKVDSDTDDSLPNYSYINGPHITEVGDLDFEVTSNPTVDEECVVCYNLTDRRTPCHHVLCVSCEQRLADDRCPCVELLFPIE